MRTLYHFTMSPFSRRTRLALAHKGLDVALRDGRIDPAHFDEAKRLWPTKTLPVLVEPDGRVIGDSTAIAHYLDAAYPEAPALWPRVDALAVFETAALVDAALNAIVDLGTRYFALREDPRWNDVKTDVLGRAQAALDALAAKVDALGRPTVSRAGWSAADMWLYTATTWLEGLPARVATSPAAAQIVTLGWRVPSGLAGWTAAHKGRAEIRALG